MPVYSDTITQVGTTPTPVRRIYAQVRYCLRITFNVGRVIYIVSHDDAIPSLPAGASVLKSRLAAIPMPDLARDAGFESGKSTSPTTTYRIADVDDELNALFADKAINGEGSYNRLIEDFEFGLGEQLDLDPTSVNYTPPKYTGIIQNHDRTPNAVIINTTDINRKIDDYIFIPLSWRLNSSISTESDEIPTTLPVNEIPDYRRIFTTKDWYLENAGETGSYAKLGDEKFWYTDLVDRSGIATFIGVKRGQLDTDAAAVTVEAGTQDGNKPEISSVQVVHENVTDFIRGFITGKFADGRQLPTGLHVGEDERWLDEEALAIHSSPLKLRFEINKKIKCRDFYEKEILALMSAVMVTDGRGRLSWTQRQRPVDEAAGQLVLDKSNCTPKQELVLKHIKTNIHPSIKINYNWNVNFGIALSPVTYRDIESESYNKIPAGTKLKEFTFKGLRSGIHTSTQLLKLAATFGDDYFYEKQELVVDSLINDIPLGTLVSVDFPQVKDDANGDQTDLKRTMLVVASNYSRRKRITTYTLSGSLQIQSARQAGVRQNNISIEETKRGKINIATLPGIVNTAQGVYTGDITLQMGQDYYYVDDASPGTGLEFLSTMNITVAGEGPRVGIHVFGPFECKATIDLTGRSHHVAGRGGTATSRATGGGTGYCLSTRSTGAINTESAYSTYVSSNETVYGRAGLTVSELLPTHSTPGRYASAPDPAINLNNGILGGVPADLSGTGGAGGPASRHYDPDRRPRIAGGVTTSNPQTVNIDGGDGGKPGGGLLIVSWGGSVSEVILNGLDAGPENQEVIGPVTVKGSRGAGGGPGSLLWVVDGNHARPLISALNVKAFHGDSSVNGTVVLEGQTITTTGVYRSPAAGIPHTINNWQAVTRIVHTPDVENVQQQPSNVLDAFFLNQRDGRVRLYIGDVPPSNANPGDMVITQHDLDSNVANVPFQILAETGWRNFVRGVDGFEYVYDALIAGQREYGTFSIIRSPTRPQGAPDGTLWYNSSNGTEWILHENRDDILLRENGVPQGENLINDLSFARSAVGNRIWVFTRDENLEPENITQPTAATGGDTSSGGSDGVIVGVYNLRVNGNTFILPDDGYYQIQDSTTYVEFWQGNGGQEVTAPDGTYNVINLTTDNRTNDVAIPQNQAGGGGTSGITLTSQGRTVAGTAYQNDGGGVIAAGRGGSVTLNDGTKIDFTVGAGGSFSVTFPSTADSNAGQGASAWTANSGGLVAQLSFTYEIA